MPKSPIPCFYAPQHAFHAPSGEFLHGRIVPYYEMPSRIETIYHALQATDLMRFVDTPPPMDETHLHAIHDPQMVAYLRTLAEQSQARIRADYAVYGMTDVLGDDEYYYESIFHPPAPNKLGLHNAPKPYLSDSTCPVGKRTWEAIHHSANLAYHATTAVRDGAPSAYAVCRPPGHHAGYDFVGGYCYINNAALAAHNLRPLGKVAVLDVDYHHGNGTQDIFWHDPDVLFVSIHADPALDYPHTSGYADETGGGAGDGTTLNLPLPHGTDERAYRQALEVALDAIRAFAPSALVVSLGFDTYHADPMGAFLLETDSYTRMGQTIAGLGLPTAYIQEGGYAVADLGILARAFFMGVQDDHR